MDSDKGMSKEDSEATEELSGKFLNIVRSDSKYSGNVLIYLFTGSLITVLRAAGMKREDALRFIGEHWDNCMKKRE